MSKIVVVTGAGTGVGRRVAEVLSKEGMVVYLIGRRKDKLIETQNLCSGETEVLQCDVSDPQAVKNAFETVEKDHSRIDVLLIMQELVCLHNLLMKCLMRIGRVL